MARGSWPRRAPRVPRSPARRRLPGALAAAPAGGSFGPRAPESGPGERSRRCPPPAGCARPDGRDADLEGARARGREARGKRAKEGRQEARSGRGGESR